MTSAFGGQRSIQLSYGCVGAVLVTSLYNGNQKFRRRAFV